MGRDSGLIDVYVNWRILVARPRRPRPHEKTNDRAFLILPSERGAHNAGIGIARITPWPHCRPRLVHPTGLEPVRLSSRDFLPTSAFAANVSAVRGLDFALARAARLGAPAVKSLHVSWIRTSLSVASLAQGFR